MTLKIKIDPLDILVSKIIRTQANGKCARCLKPTEYNRLQAAHFHGRANKKVRYDLQNLAPLCFGCHQYLDSRAMEKVEFFKKRLGEKEFEKLNQRANWRRTRKIDKKAIEVYLKFKLNEIENEISSN